MSLTEAETVFASVHETALNDFLIAFFTGRPRYLVYGSPSFVPATTVAETTMSAINFPGVPGGIQWRVRLGIPQVDLFKQTMGLPPELSLDPGQFGLRIDVELCLDCRRLKIDPKPPRDNPKERKDDHRPNDDRHPLSEVTCCKLQVFAVGHLDVVAVTGDDAIALAVDAIEIVDIKPDELESVLECLLFMILQAVLAEVRLPLTALRALPAQDSSEPSRTALRSTPTRPAPPPRPIKKASATRSAPSAAALRRQFRGGYNPLSDPIGSIRCRPSERPQARKS